MEDFKFDNRPNAERLNGVKVGDVLRFRNPKIYEYGFTPMAGWNPQMKELINEKIIITEDLMKLINNDSFYYRMKKSNGGSWSISLDMLEFDVNEVPPPELKDHFVFDYSSEEIDKIKEEMIEKADKKALISLLSIAGSNNRDKVFANKEIMSKYLSDWADNKWKLYVLFGRSLFINREIQHQIDLESMYEKINELIYKYPKYAEIISCITTESFIKNSLEGYDFKNSEVYSFLQYGMKVSKFFHTLCNDDDLDNALSYLLEQREIKTNIFISIDPYDYCTMSTNKNGWNSCHRITDGEFCGGGLAYMLDPSSTIAYCSSGNIMNYNLFDFKFSGNSKSWRQVVNIDTKSFAAIFGREYPAQRDVITKGIRTLYQDTVDKFINNSTAWKIRHNDINGNYNLNSNFCYWDVNHGYNYKFIHLPDYFKDSSININVGVEYLYDVVDGDKIDSIQNRRVRK